ncbi:MAG TPA: glycosyl hydrolase [Chthoniobacteraceae bacterium]|nr:glycosyl hydrolase [Chthoniobacteraceae bacterium]
MKKHASPITRPLCAALTAALFATSVFAQDPVPIGKGSYAAYPPPGAEGGKLAKNNDAPLNLLKADDRPIPTNKYWSNLLFKGDSGLWSYPMHLATTKNALSIAFPTQFKGDGSGPDLGTPLVVTGMDAGPARVKDWSDWLISFRMGTDDKYMDVTLGEGMPCTWLEFNGMQPTLASGGKGADATTYFDKNGNNIATPPATGDCFGMAFNGRQFGIFAPDGTQFTANAGAIKVTFSGKQQYLVIAPLPAPKDLAYYYQYAFAIPRDTKMSWQYDPTRAIVNTTWKVTTEALKGNNHDIVQGWIPHHYHQTTVGMKFNDLSYITPRGPMKCAAGTEFQIGFPFNGILPNLPAPKDTTGDHPFNPAQMQTYFDDFLKGKKFGADTYWGGKDVLLYGQCIFMSQQLNNPSYKQFVDDLRDGLSNWFTYTPGKADHYFMRYPKLKALVGTKTSYGSDMFNDHHFHYGYFTYASALMCAADRQFATDYGPMATQVAKEYANWDRNDKDYPFFRTFDIWQGHSWAGGTGSGDGENQESSSEAMQSWAGLTYLGQALGNKEMRDAGAMGYAMESNAVLEYWFNFSGDVFDKAWPHPIDSMPWSGHNAYATYFTGDHAWFYAIEWLPCSPMLSYLVRDPAFAKKMFDNMAKDCQAQGKPGTLASFGDNPGGVILGYVSMYDPQTVVQYFDTADKKVANNSHEMIMAYYTAHSMISLGLVDWKSHGSSATSMVYYNDQTKKHTYIAWNPLAQPEKVTFYEGDKVVDEMTAAPQALTSDVK